MVFDTYTIDGNNPSAVKAAEMNGLLEFKFYKEKFRNYGGTGFHSPGIFTTDKDWSLKASDSTSTYYSGTLTGNSGTLSNTSSVTFDGSSFDTSPEFFKSNSIVETGRVEKGEESNQNMNMVDVDFDSFPFHTINYQLKPESNMSRSVSYQSKEIRNYCSNCGYRIRKQSWKYCPHCSEKLI